MAAHSLALSAPVVSVSHGHATTTSKAVADYFHKNHRDVLRKIEALLPDLPEEYRERNFALAFFEVPGPNGATRREPCYQLTRDGFTLLAMGFTGKQALQWKIRYIEAFNEMESRLHGEGSLPPGHVAISKANLEQLRLHLLDWKACSYRLYGPLSELGVKEVNALHYYAQGVSLVWGLATRFQFSNGQPHCSSASPSDAFQRAPTQHQAPARPVPALISPAGNTSVAANLYHDTNVLVAQIDEWLTRHGVRQVSAYDVAELALGLSEATITDGVLRCVGLALERLGWVSNVGVYVLQR